MDCLLRIRRSIVSNFGVVMTDHAVCRRDKRVTIRADIRITAEDGCFAEATLINISRYGLSADGLKHFHPDSLLEVAFPNGSGCKGHAVWKDDYLEGIAFEPPMSVDDFKVLMDSLHPIALSQS